MSNVNPETLDLSRLPSPTLVPVDYEEILAQRKAALVAAFAAEGLEYDVEESELDPAIVLEEIDAGREMLALQAINDAGRANMLAFSTGADLDQLGANIGVYRLQVGTDSTTLLPIMESNDRFRRRIQLWPESLAPGGSMGGYIFNALTAAPTIADATAVVPAPGEVVVSIMGSGEDPTPTQAEVDAVREYLMREDVKPATDILTVRAATVIVADLAADIFLYAGPDQAVVLADARKAAETFLAQNKRLGRDLNRGAWIGRLWRDTVHSVIQTAGPGDLIVDRGTVVWARSLTLNAAGVAE